jgi:glycosyltransferase involved in cell wall biosynthesis
MLEATQMAAPAHPVSAGRITKTARGFQERMARTLFFAPKECWPFDTGAKLRNYYLARELASRAEVTYLGFRDTAAPAVAEAFDGKTPIEGKPARVDQFCESYITVDRRRGYSISNIVRGLATSTPISVLNYTTRAMRQRLSELLAAGGFDVVQVESIHLAAYLPAIRAADSRPLAILDWHNVESEVMERYGKYAPTIARRYYARATEKRLRDLERKALSEFDAHIVVSDRDRAHLLSIAPTANVFVIENGVDIEYYSTSALEQAHSAWLGRRPLVSLPGGQVADKLPGGSRHRLLFVGSMDYHANVDAVTYFAREVWPSLHLARPDLNFTVVGRNPGSKVKALASLPGVEVTGTVDDVRPYYGEALASIVPLRVGGGSRLKILEAMASGVPVVATTLGAEGLDIIPGEHLIIADSPRQLTHTLTEMREGSDAWRLLAAAGRSLVFRKYGWSALGAALADVQTTLLSNRLVQSECPEHHRLRKPVSLL